MIRKVLVVAALLLTGLTEVAVAAEGIAEHHSKNAQKVLATLKTLGVTDPDIQQFVDEIDKHVEDGAYKLDEEKMMDGKVTLRYQLDMHPSADHLELVYKPNESHVQYTVRPHGVMVEYHIKLN